MSGLVRWIILLALVAAVCGPLAFSGWVIGSIATAAEILFWVALVGVVGGLVAGAWVALQASRNAVARRAVDPLQLIERPTDAARDPHRSATAASSSSRFNPGG